MFKNPLATIIIVVLAALVVFSYFGGLWQNKDKIHQAELDRIRMRAMRDSLITVVAYRDSIEKMLTAQVEVYKDQAQILRHQVDILETEREENQLSVRRLRKKEDLQEQLKVTFPEMASSDWGITEVYNEANNIGIEYLLIPLWFSETFIIDHQNAESYLQQRDKLLMVDSLNLYVITLQDSIIVLEKANRDAYEEGYNIAYIKFDSLSQKYIAQLKKGKIGWGWSAAGIVASGFAGYLIGSSK
jgi:hypothetical protein